MKKNKINCSDLKGVKMVIRGLFDGNLIGLVSQRSKESRKFSHFPAPIIIITISRAMTLSENVQTAAI